MTAQRVVGWVLLVELLVSVVLVALMAARSPIDAHPDEALHVSAAEYFRNHILPPAVGDPAAAATYSAWGMSYVDEADIVYVAFGGAATLGRAMGLAPAASMRALQVGLYLLLIAWVLARARTFVPAVGFAVLTPQVWYVFSYVNGDTLPLLLFTGLVLELAWRESSIRSYLRGARPRPTAGVWAFGALLGLLLLSKRNYLVGVAFLGFAVLWLKDEVAGWKRVALPLAIAVAIALPWGVYHAWVNDFRTAARVLEEAERKATPDLRLSLATSPGSFRFLALRAKGVSVLDMLTRLNWLWVTFMSFSGVYGWMVIRAVPWVYRAFGALDTILLALLILPVALRGPRRARILLAGVLAFAGLVVAQSVYRSWTMHFQPQGRYLFPMLPILLFYWWQCEEPRLRTAALATTACLGALSIVSFALIALNALVVR